MPFNSTSGDAAANSYGSVEEADAYFDTKLYRSLWPETGAAGADLSRKQNALMEACRSLENYFYRGRATSAAQRLKWPRSMVRRMDSSDYLDADNVPDVIKEAQYELAYHLLKNDPTNEVSEELKQFKRLKLPGIELEMKESATAEGAMPTEVMRKLSPYLGVSPGTARLIRS